MSDAEQKPAKKDVIHYMKRQGYVYDLAKKLFVGDLRPRAINYELAEQAYIDAHLQSLHQAEAKPQNPYICCVCHSTNEQHCDDCKDLCTMAKPIESDTFKTLVDGELEFDLGDGIGLEISVLMHAVYLDAQNGHPREVVESATRQALQHIAVHLQAAVRDNKEDILHRVADVLSWHSSQGNIEMKHRSVEQIMQQLKQEER